MHSHMQLLNPALIRDYRKGEKYFSHFLINVCFVGISLRRRVR